LSTAATLTPATTAADLLDELRQLVGRHDGASTLDELGELADELSTVLRRTRGRLARLKRQAAPKPADEPAAKPAEKPAPAAERPAAAEQLPAQPAAEPKQPPPQRPAEPRVARAPGAETRSKRPAPPRARAAAPERPPRRLPTTAVLALAAITAVWVILGPRLAPPARAIARAVRSALHRCAAVARSISHRVARLKEARR
jgi:hypothetical protein